MPPMVAYEPMRSLTPPSLRRLAILLSGAGLIGPPALAQSPDPPPDAAEPAFEVPPDPALPPLPPPNADFKAEQQRFEEVQTAPEDLIGQPTLAPRTEPLRYEEYPALAYTTQAVAGLLGAGVVGLAGANLGEFIDPPDELQPLGGFHGPAFGGFAGTAIGSALGVWAGGMLFEKQTHPGWIALGSAAGTVVGGGAALGIAALGSNDTATATLAVGSALLFQIGGAILFGELFLPPPESVRQASDRGLIRPPEDDDF